MTGSLYRTGLKLPFQDGGRSGGAEPLAGNAVLGPRRAEDVEHFRAFGAGPQAQFDEDRFIIRDDYAPGVENLKKTFERVAKHRDERVNDACRQSLDYARGDDFLQVGSIDFACTREYLLRSVPRDSLPSVLYRATFVLLGGLVVPLVHWFLPRRQWGDLRPWRP